MSKCLECGAAMKVRTERSYRYQECGLREVTLAGVQVRRCTRCENYEISIPRIAQLHDLIARTIIEKRTRLRGPEVRFLRKSLGWSGIELARRMGVAEETVSRWENGAAPIGPQADRLLRVMVAQDRLRTTYPPERLSRIDPKKATSVRMRLEAHRQDWELLSA